ncbi:hypothetical protein R1sor_025185 [Riccia sorocarpa]|uniref:Uncharacterized protein n=1 Tax=Riccia sorocarpa TaxID=122646 RepID=A0ABD3G9F0_9MARC
MEGRKTSGGYAAASEPTMAEWQPLFQCFHKSNPKNADKPTRRGGAKTQDDEVEDTLHAFWKCSQAANTWSRVAAFVASTNNQCRNWRPKCNQALLAVNLPKTLPIDGEWWETIRGAIIWAIWLARNAMCFSGETWHARKIDALIWYRISLYTRIEWRRQKAADREVFKSRWAFEAAGIEVIDDYTIKVPRQAPWRKQQDREENVGDPP